MHCVIGRSDGVDIIEFAEKILGFQLLDYQKEILRRLDRLPIDTGTIVFARQHCNNSMFGFYAACSVLKTLYETEVNKCETKV